MKKFKNKKILLSFIILFLIGLAFGLAFNFYISDIDKTLISKELSQYFSSIKSDLSYGEGLLNSIKTNLLYITLIWITGVIPFLFLINYFLVFYKGFLIGFSVSSIIMLYKLKGIALSLIFLFPHEFINVFIFITLGVASIKFSKKIFNKIKNNNMVNFNKDYKNYIKIYIVFIVISVISSLLEVFFNSLLVRLVI